MEPVRLLIKSVDVFVENGIKLKLGMILENEQDRHGDST